jgi:tetratricopeptide (TPR) repeat protein
MLATVRLRLGHQQDAIRHYRAALDLIRETGDRYPEVDILIGLATATGEIDHARHALALAMRAGYRALQGRAMNTLAGILLARGQREDAAERARRALAIHRETGYRLGEAHARTVLIQAAPES